MAAALISAMHKSSGKTLVSLGIAAALAAGRSGARVLLEKGPKRLSPFCIRCTREAVVGPRPDLHKPHAFFEQSASRQAVATEILDLDLLADAGFFGGCDGRFLVEAIHL